MRNLIRLLALILVIPTLANAQVTGPAYTFVAGTVASPDEVNSNFTTIYANALNRTGGTMTGTLTAQVILPDGDNTRNFGSAAASWASGWFDGTLTVGTLALTTLTCTGCVGATQLAATTVSANSYGSASAIPTFTVDADGRLTAAGSTTFAVTNLSDGSNVALLNAANAFTAQQNISGNDPANTYLGLRNSLSTGNRTFRLTAGVTGTSQDGFSIYDSVAAQTWLTLSNAGLLTVSGFGAHSFSAGGTGSHNLTVTNTTNGTGNSAYIGVAADVGLLGYLQAFPTSYSTSGPNVALGALLGGGGAGGISIAATDASGAIRFYSGGTTERARFHAAGGLTVGTTTDPGAAGVVWATGAAGYEAFIALQGAFGTGAVTGNGVAIGNNSSGGGAAGYLTLSKKNGNANSLWVDASNDLRIAVDTLGPTEDGTTRSDTSGAVVGTQTSTRASKNILGQFTDYEGALRSILGAPLWSFEYKSGAYNRQQFVGITTDDSPEFGMDLGRSFNPVTAFGYTVAAFKAQQEQIDALHKRITALEAAR